MTIANYRKGIRKTSAMVPNVVAATPLTLYQLSPGRTCVIRKIHMFNNNPANTIVQFGTGLAGAYVQAMPAWFVVAGMELPIREEDIPEFEFTGDITMQASVAAAAPNDVDVMIEVEEFQGPTG